MAPPNRITAYPLEDPLIWFDQSVFYDQIDDLLSVGVIGTDDLKVVANSPNNLGVTVKAGRAYVPYSNGGKRYFKLSADVKSSDVEFLRNVGSAHASLPRIDRVVAKVLDSKINSGDAAKKGMFDVIPGTATSGATLGNLNGAASVPAGSLLIGNLLIPAAGSSLSDANIDTTVRAKATVGAGLAQSSRPKIAIDGTLQTSRGTINIIHSGEITITAADDAANDKIDITFTAPEPDIKLLRDYTVTGSPKVSIDSYSDFGNTLLPSTYSDLLIKVWGQSAETHDDDELRMRLNNDSGANMYENGLETISTAGTTWNTNASGTNNFMVIGDLPGQNHPNKWGCFEVWLPNYTVSHSGGCFQTIMIQGDKPLDNNVRYIGGGAYRDGPITRVTIYLNSANLETGTRVQIFGVM